MSGRRAGVFELWLEELIVDRSGIEPRCQVREAALTHTQTDRGGGHTGEDREKTETRRKARDPARAQS